MRAAVLYTGGKDSHYALLKALEAGYKPCLVTVVPKRADSYMFHTVNVRWAFLHGEASGLEQHGVYVSGEKEVEVEELYTSLKELKQRCGFEALVTGAVASRYQKERADRLAERLGVRHIAPLWGKNQEELLLEEVAVSKFIITAVMAMGLGPELLGVVITEELARRIIELSKRYGFSPVGEGGEYETYVVKSPLFAIEVTGEKIWRPTGWGYFEIKKAAVKSGLRIFKYRTSVT